MKHTFLGLIFSVLAVAASAVAGDWNINEVRTASNDIAGYIYYTGAQGTQISSRTDKYVTGLRIVCTAESFKVEGHADPLVIILWDKMEGTSTQTVNARTNRPIHGDVQTAQWNQDGQLLYRTTTESKDLIQSLKVNKSIMFTWIDNAGVQRMTTFNLTDFNTHLADFVKLCGTDL